MFISSIRTKRSTTPVQQQQQQRPSTLNSSVAHHHSPSSIFSGEFGSSSSPISTARDQSVPISASKSATSAFDEQYCKSGALGQPPLYMGRVGTPSSNSKHNKTMRSPSSAAISPRSIPRPLSATALAAAPKAKGSSQTPPLSQSFRPASAAGLRRSSPRQPHHHQQMSSSYLAAASTSSSPFASFDELVLGGRSKVPVVSAQLHGTSVPLDETELTTVSETVLRHAAMDEASRLSLLGQKGRLDERITKRDAQYRPVSQSSRERAMKKLQTPPSTGNEENTTTTSPPPNPFTRFPVNSLSHLTNPPPTTSASISGLVSSGNFNNSTTANNSVSGLNSRPSMTALEFMRERKRKMRADELIHQSSMFRRSSVGSSFVTDPSPRNDISRSPSLATNRAYSISLAPKPQHIAQSASQVNSGDEDDEHSEPTLMWKSFPFVCRKLLVILSRLRVIARRRLQVASQFFQNSTEVKRRKLLKGTMQAWREVAETSKWRRGTIIHKMRRLCVDYRLRRMFSTWRRVTIVAWYVENIWFPTQELLAHPNPSPMLTVSTDLPRLKVDLTRFLATVDQLSPWVAAQRERAGLSRLHRAKKLLKASAGGHHHPTSSSTKASLSPSASPLHVEDDPLHAASVNSQPSMGDIAAGLSEHTNNDPGVVGQIARMLEAEEERERDEEVRLLQREEEINRAAREEATSVMAAMARARAIANGEFHAAASLDLSNKKSIDATTTTTTTASITAASSLSIQRAQNAEAQQLRQHRQDLYNCFPEVANHVWNLVVVGSSYSGKFHSEEDDNENNSALEVESFNAGGNNNISDDDDDEMESYCVIGQDGSLGLSRGMADITYGSVSQQGGLGTLFTAKDRARRIHQRETYVRPSWHHWWAYIRRRREKKVTNAILVNHTNTVLRSKRLLISMQKWQKELQASLSTSYFAVQFKGRILRNWKAALDRKIVYRDDEIVADKIIEQRRKATVLSHWITRMRNSSLQLYAGTAAVLVNRRVVLEAVFAWQGYPYITGTARNESLSKSKYAYHNNNDDGSINDGSSSSTPPPYQSTLQERLAHTSRLQIICFIAWRTYVKRCRRYQNFKTHHVENFAHLLVSRAFYVWRSRGQCDWVSLERPSEQQAPSVGWDRLPTSPQPQQRRISNAHHHQQQQFEPNTPTVSDLLEYDTRPPIGALSALSLVQPTAAMVIYNVGGMMMGGGGGKGGAAPYGGSGGGMGGDQLSAGSVTWRGPGASGTGNSAYSPSGGGGGGSPAASMTYSSARQQRATTVGISMSPSAGGGGGGMGGGGGGVSFATEQYLATKSLYAIPPTQLTKTAIKDFSQLVLSSSGATSPYDIPPTPSTLFTHVKALISIFDILLVTHSHQHLSNGLNGSMGSSGRLSLTASSPLGISGMSSNTTSAEYDMMGSSRNVTPQTRWLTFQPVLAPTVSYSWQTTRPITVLDCGLAAAGIITDPTLSLQHGTSNNAGYNTTNNYAEMSMRVAGSYRSTQQQQQLSPTNNDSAGSVQGGSSTVASKHAVGGSMSGTARSLNHRPPQSPSAAAGSTVGNNPNRSHLVAAFQTRGGGNTADSPSSQQQNAAGTISSAPTVIRRIAGTITAAIAHKLFLEELYGTPPPAVYTLCTALYRSKMNAADAGLSSPLLVGNVNTSDNNGAPLRPPLSPTAGPIGSGQQQQPSPRLEASSSGLFGGGGRRRSSLTPRPPGSSSNPTVTIIDEDGGGRRAGGRRQYSLFSNATIKITTGTNNTGVNSGVPNSPTLAGRRASSPGNVSDPTAASRGGGGGSAFETHNTNTDNNNTNNNTSPDPTSIVDGHWMRNCFLRYVLQRLGLAVVCYTAINSQLRRRKSAKVSTGQGGHQNDVGWRTLGEEIIASQSGFAVQQQQQQSLINTPPSAPLQPLLIDGGDDAEGGCGASSTSIHTSMYLGVTSTLERQLVETFLDHHNNQQRTRVARRKKRLGSQHVVSPPSVMYTAENTLTLGGVTQQWAHVRLYGSNPQHYSPGGGDGGDGGGGVGDDDVLMRTMSNPLLSISPVRGGVTPSSSSSPTTNNILRGTSSFDPANHTHSHGRGNHYNNNTNNTAASTTHNIPTSRTVVGGTVGGTLSVALVSLLGRLQEFSKVSAALEEHTSTSRTASVIKTGFAGVPHGSHVMIGVALRRQEELDTVMRGDASPAPSALHSPSPSRLRLKSDVRDTGARMSIISPQKRNTTAASAMSLNNTTISIPKCLQVMGPSTLQKGWDMFLGGGVGGGRSALSEPGIHTLITAPSIGNMHMGYTAVESFLDYQCCKMYGAGDVSFMRRVHRLGLLPTLEAVRRERLAAAHGGRQPSVAASDISKVDTLASSNRTQGGGGATSNSSQYLDANAALLFALAAGLPVGPLQAVLQQTRGGGGGGMSTSGGRNALRSPSSTPGGLGTHRPSSTPPQNRLPFATNITSSNSMPDPTILLSQPSTTITYSNNINIVTGNDDAASNSSSTAASITTPSIGGGGVGDGRQRRIKESGMTLLMLVQSMTALQGYYRCLSIQSRMRRQYLFTRYECAASAARYLFQQQPTTLTHITGAPTTETHSAEAVLAGQRSGASKSARAAAMSEATTGAATKGAAKQKGSKQAWAPESEYGKRQSQPHYGHYSLAAAKQRAHFEDGNHGLSALGVDEDSSCGSDDDDDGSGDDNDDTTTPPSRQPANIAGCVIIAPTRPVNRNRRLVELRQGMGQALDAGELLATLTNRVAANQMKESNPGLYYQLLTMRRDMNKRGGGMRNKKSSGGGPSRGLQSIFDSARGKGGTRMITIYADHLALQASICLRLRLERRVCERVLRLIASGGGLSSSAAYRANQDASSPSSKGKKARQQQQLKNAASSSSSTEALTQSNHMMKVSSSVLGRHCSGLPTKTKALKDMIKSKELGYLMEAHSGISARIVEETGFKAIWGSGLSMSAQMGVRDNNEASWTQVCEVLEQMSDVTSIPILVDADTGYGNFNNARRLVKKLEKIGIAGACIEDKLFPKTNSLLDERGAQPLADVKEFANKITAMKDTQTDENFCVVARVESFIAGWPLEEALKRATAYADAGADAVLIHSKKSDPSDIEAFMKHWDHRAPVVIVPTNYPKTPVARFQEIGVSSIIWANHNVRSSIAAMQKTSKTIFEQQSLIEASKDIATVKEIFRLQNQAEYLTAEDKYLPKQ